MIELDHNALWHTIKKEAFHASVLDMELAGKEHKVLLRDVQMKREPLPLPRLKVIVSVGSDVESSVAVMLMVMVPTPTAVIVEPAKMPVPLTAWPTRRPVVLLTVIVWEPAVVVPVGNTATALAVVMF